ncbi:MAG: SDR family oxidoreductase [Phycisphaerae bacterium]|nr:SDR family oxidoreductase [Phycisphaerae bacterium]
MNQAETSKAGNAAHLGTVLVTGANRGIGLGLVKALRAGGARVIGTARTPADVSAVKALGVEGMQLDVAVPESVDAFVRGLAGRPIDVVIHNAGVVNRGGTVLDLDMAEVERILRVNTLGPMRLTKALLPNLRASARKTVVVISSALGSLTGNEHGGFVGYRESKAAINMFTRSVAAELRGEGFVVVTMSPGWVRTDMGGAEAPLSVEQSVDGIVKVIASLSEKDSGAFISYDGDRVAW